MNSRRLSRPTRIALAAVTAAWLHLGLASASHAQDFDFDRLIKQASAYTVVLDVKVEYSFGSDVNEHEERLIATIVRADGLVMFDGGFLSEDNPFMPTGGMTFRSTPKRITATTVDRKEYAAEFVGVDNYTGFGFALITGAERPFTPVRFVKPERLRVGDWLATLVLLPEYVEPQLATDVAMVSAIITRPERFPLTVGFSPFEFGSVLYDSRLNPIGLLGQMEDPGDRSGGGMMGEFQQMNIPLLGVITIDRLEALIASPPRRGQAARSWLGITMQSLTADIAEFLQLGEPGGVIVNEVVPGSPAESGGLMVGDVISTVDGQRVEVDREEELSVFQRQVASKAVGSTVDLAVLRPLEQGLDTLHLQVTLAAAPLAAADAADFEYAPYELTVRNLVFSDYVGYNVAMNSLSGVVVTSMQPGGLADISGLAPGDVIQRVNEHDVASVDQFAQVMEAVDSEQPQEVVLLVWRFGQTVFVNVRTE